MRRVLVTGFEPYGTTPTNPAQLTAERHLMYGVLHHLRQHASPIRAGWVHLPALPEVAARDENLGEPSMTVDTAAAGLRAAIDAALTHESDVHTPIHSRLQI